MQCPICKSRNLSTEPVLKCNDCSYEFIINPNLGLLWSDASILTLGERVANQGTPRYTLDGLLFQAMKENRKSRLTNRMLLIVSSGVLILTSNQLPWGMIPLWLTFILVFVPFTFWAIENTKLNGLTRFTDLKKAMELWFLAKKPMPALLETSLIDLSEYQVSTKPSRINLIVKDKLTKAWFIENGIIKKEDLDILCLEEEDKIAKLNSTDSKVFSLNPGSQVKYIGLSQKIEEQLKSIFDWHENELPIHSLPYSLVEEKLLHALKSEEPIQISSSDLK